MAVFPWPLFSQDLSFEIMALEEEKRRAVEKEAGFCRFAVLKGESQQWMGCTPQKISISRKKVMVERCSFQDAGFFVGGVRFLV